MTTTELAPQFAVTVRGYDRMQVEDYVDTLREWLANATLRMEAAESENGHLREQVALLRSRLVQVEQLLDDGPPRTIAAMGDRVARILEITEEGAAAARADAEAEAVAIVGRARQEATDLVHGAQGRLGEMEAFIAGAADRAAAMVAQAEVEATERANRLQAEAETRAAGREAQASERARVLVADAEAQRQLTLARMEEEQAILRADLLRLTTERDGIRDGLTRLRDSLRTTIEDLPGAEAVAAPPPPAPPVAPAPAPATSGSWGRLRDRPAK
jgi:cell division septum initiation protein DivIVA